MKFYIRYEKMGGEYYYMIYTKFFIFNSFFERWNTPESAIARLNELCSNQHANK